MKTLKMWEGKELRFELKKTFITKMYSIFWKEVEKYKGTPLLPYEEIGFVEHCNGNTGFLPSSRKIGYEIYELQDIIDFAKELTK